MIEEAIAILDAAEQSDVPPHARRTLIRAAESAEQYLDDGNRKRLERLRTANRRETDLLLKKQRE